MVLYGQTLISIGKGFKLPKQMGTINLESELLFSINDPRNSRENFTRSSSSFRYKRQLRFNENILDLRTSGSYLFTLDSEKTDPDINYGQKDIYKSDLSKYQLSLDAGLMLSGKAAKNIELSLSATYAHEQLQRERYVSPTGPMPQPLSLTEGKYDAAYLPQGYNAELLVDGKPLNLFSSLDFSITPIVGNTIHKISSGLEWQSFKNFGDGEIFDMQYPPFPGTGSGRPRNFRDIPAMHTLSAYIENEFTWKPGNQNLLLIPGVRISSMPGMDEAYAMQGRIYTEPRINGSWVWHLATDEPQRYPFAYYSSVASTFGIRDFTGEETILRDANGNFYSEEEFDSIIPMFYYRQLASRGELPDSLHGKELSQKIIATHNFYFRYRPRQRYKPSIPLYPLFESMPARVDLEIPGDVFHLSDNLKFIDPETNEIIPGKSKKIDTRLNHEGFEGPPQLVTGSPTTRKPYDEGYFITDKNNRLFHLKMVNGKPYVGEVPLKEDVIPDWIVTTEYPTKSFYGFLFSKDGRLFTISTDNYSLDPVPLPDFDIASDDLLIMGNLFYWNVQVTSEKSRTTLAINSKTRQVIDSVSFEADSHRKKIFQPGFTRQNFVLHLGKMPVYGHV